MASMIASGLYDITLGSRILGGTAIRGGMPIYKFIANRILTFIQNIVLGTKLSEFHTGYRAFHRRVLQGMPLLANSNDFIFDNEFLVQSVFFKYRIGEISTPTKYFPEASSINLYRSIKYGFETFWVSLKYHLAKWGVAHFLLFTSKNEATNEFFLK